MQTTQQVKSIHFFMTRGIKLLALCSWGYIKDHPFSRDNEVGAYDDGEHHNVPDSAYKTTTGADGKRTYVKRTLLWIPSKTHMKELPAIGGELHKIQAAEWILDGMDEDAAFTYIADAANTQQKEILAQLLSRRAIVVS